MIVFYTILFQDACIRANIASMSPKTGLDTRLCRLNRKSSDFKDVSELISELQARRTLDTAVGITHSKLHTAQHELGTYGV